MNVVRSGFILWLVKVSFVGRYGHRMNIEGLGFILWLEIESFVEDMDIE